MMQGIKVLIADIFKDYDFLIKEKVDFMDDSDREFYHKIRWEKGNIAIALHKLSKWLRQYYGKKVIILLARISTRWNPKVPLLTHGWRAFWAEHPSALR